MSRTTFADLGVPADIIAVLARGDIDAPFPIQAATLPDALAGRDICGRAPTGSGKTLAFAIALIERTQHAQPRRPQALVLVPTRELAAQVSRELKPLAEARRLQVATVYGGVGYGEQKSALRGGVDILVACPGRLEDLLEQRQLTLDDVRTVVVDEADRMADMGFLPAVRRLLDRTHADRQTLLFSATLDGEVDVLVKRYQRSPKRFEVETSQDKQGDVSHHFWRAERDERLGITERLIGSHATSIVFCRTRHGADRLAKQLTQRGISAAPIHGSRTQPQRERALQAFQDGRVRALVATDVAARGIHVDDVSCVLHFDPPASDKDYVHRSGRTGRAGADGTVVTLVAIGQMHEVRQLQKALKLRPRVDRPDFTDMPIVHVEPRPEVAAKPKPSSDRDRRRQRPHGQGGQREQRSDEQRRTQQRRRRPKQHRKGRPPTVGTAR